MVGAACVGMSLALGLLESGLSSAGGVLPHATAGVRIVVLHHRSSRFIQTRGRTMKRRLMGNHARKRYSFGWEKGS